MDLKKKVPNRLRIFKTKMNRYAYLYELGEFNSDVGFCRAIT